MWRLAITDHSRGSSLIGAANGSVIRRRNTRNVENTVSKPNGRENFGSFAPMTIQSMPPAPTETESPSPEAASRVTPMMEQYLEIKAANPGLLLFYRMGDFYELFFEDAEAASRSLGITLTKRGKHLGQDIPMCGVPVERADDYLHRLIALGHRVAEIGRAHV